MIEPRGMHFAGPVDRSIESMAAHALGEIDERLDIGERCVLLGFSAGVTAAFETACRLHAGGRQIDLVLLDAVPGGRRLPGEGEVTVVSGDHDSMLMHPHVSAIADVVATAIVTLSTLSLTPSS